MLEDHNELQKQLLQLQKDLEEERKKRQVAEKLREEERQGRIRAEQALRQINTSTNPSSSSTTATTDETDEDVVLQPIGYLRSCFRERNGTPRQGLLAPASRAFLKMRESVNPTASLCRLEEFTHVWLIFMFHSNTNTGSSVKKTALSKQRNNRNLSAVKSKVKPPRLGQKVGLFSTRTPHRPNAIGLSVARVERVDEKGVLHLSAVDLIDGTPILDIKPYIPEYDASASVHTPSLTPIAAEGGRLFYASTPDWIHAKASPFRRVEWTSPALFENLKKWAGEEDTTASGSSGASFGSTDASGGSTGASTGKRYLEFYHQQSEELKKCIEQVLLLDVRRVNGRVYQDTEEEAEERSEKGKMNGHDGEEKDKKKEVREEEEEEVEAEGGQKSSEENSQKKSVAKKRVMMNNNVTHNFRADNLVVYFRCVGDLVTVVDVQLYGQT